MSSFNPALPAHSCRPRPFTAPASMGQRSIEAFFSKPGSGSKRSTGTVAAAGCSDAAGEQRPAQQQPQQRVDPAQAACAADWAVPAGAPVERMPAPEAGAEAVAQAAAEAVAEAAAAGAAGAVSTASRQLTAQQRFRMLANK